jgi:hypothetical protein
MTTSTKDLTIQRDRFGRIFLTFHLTDGDHRRIARSDAEAKRIINRVLPGLKLDRIGWQ